MDLDRFFSVSISSDGLKAALTLVERKPPPGGQGLKEDEMLSAIESVVTAKGVSEPMDAAAVTSALRRWLKDGRKVELAAAKGRAPVAGANAKVTLFRPKPAEAAGRSVHRVDRRNQGFVANVEAGAVLATVTHPTPGVPGVTVTGVEIPASDAKGAAIEAGDGVSVTEVGGVVTYRATTTGIVCELSETRIEVGHEIEIKGDVDHGTGNIDAWGAVTVRGSIEGGFSVRARGDVTVDGTCESAFIESGGDVVLNGGVLGRSGVTEVKARGNVTVRFVENAKVESGGDVTVKDSVINSRILAAGAIDVGGKGTVLASHLAARRTISAGTFGSEARLPVELVVGTDPLAWRKLLRLRHALRFLRRAQMRGAQLRSGRASSLRAKVANDRECKRRRRSEQARRQVERRERALRAVLLEGGGPRVIVRKGAFPKTTVHLGPHVFEVREELRGGVLAIDEARAAVTWMDDAVASTRKGQRGS